MPEGADDWQVSASMRAYDVDGGEVRGCDPLLEGRFAQEASLPVRR